jgi:hypothetical protein
MTQSTKNKEGMSEIVEKRRHTGRTCGKGSSSTRVYVLETNAV